MHFHGKLPIANPAERKFLPSALFFVPIQLCRLQFPCKEISGGPPSKYLAWIVIHPLLNLLYLLFCHIVKICTFWEKSPDKPVHILIGTSFVCTVRVAVENQCPLSFASVGHLYAFKVLKLTPIVYSDRLEYLVEQLAQFSLQAIQSLYHACRCMVWHG